MNAGALEFVGGTGIFCSACAGLSIKGVCLAVVVLYADGLPASGTSCLFFAVHFRLEGMMTK